MKINSRYLIAFILLFALETIIALYVHDTIIRPFIGDLLVIILIYCFIKSFTTKELRSLPIVIFLFATFVELCQYFNIVDLLHLQNSSILRTIIGTTFDLKDIICYLVGTILLVFWQKFSKA